MFFSLFVLVHSCLLRATFDKISQYLILSTPIYIHVGNRILKTPRSSLQHHHWPCPQKITIEFDWHISNNKSVINTLQFSIFISETMAAVCHIKTCMWNQQPICYLCGCVLHWVSEILRLSSGFIEGNQKWQSVIVKSYTADWQPHGVQRP